MHPRTPASARTRTSHRRSHPFASLALALLRPFAPVLRPTLARWFLPPPQWHTQAYDHIDELAIDVLTRNGLPVHLVPTDLSTRPPHYEVVWPDALLWFVAPEGLLVELADGTRLVHDTTQRTAGGRVETMLRYLHTYDPCFDSGEMSVAALAHLIEHDSGGPAPSADHGAPIVPLPVRQRRRQAQDARDIDDAPGAPARADWRRSA